MWYTAAIKKGVENMLRPDDEPRPRSLDDLFAGPARCNKAILGLKPGPKNVTLGIDGVLDEEVARFYAKVQGVLSRMAVTEPIDEQS